MILFLLSLYFINPVKIGEAIYTTDSRHSTIYRIKENSVEKIVSSPGVGYRFSISHERNQIGFKIINEKGQRPALYDIKRDEIEYLHDYVPLCGQPSLSPSITAFTSGEKLVLIKNGSRKIINLGNYSNLTPISPDGNHIAFNDIKDRIKLKNLNTDEEKIISPEGCFGPRWSPDGEWILFTSLGDKIYSYNIISDTLHYLGKGHSPRWSPEGDRIIYYRKEIEKLEVVSSDIFITSPRGKITEKLTFTDNELEITPSFSADGKKVTYTILNKPEIKIGDFRDKKLTKVKTVISPDTLKGVYQENKYNDSGTRDSLEFPYIHQVYDTPDWYNGHWACAPTTAMMVIAGYYKLPVWLDTVSTPYTHLSYYGKYICERYRFREVYYNLAADDPNGTPSYGGYGYMWYGSYSPYSRMHYYFQNHGFSSQRDDNPTWSELLQEHDNGHPYSLCVGLTSSGHLILSVGYVYGQHTVIANDPYGDKNTSGYPSYDGKYARYDWPGYNNGYENLNSVYWTNTSHGTAPEPSDTIVEDIDFNSGFSMNNSPPSAMRYYRDLLAGNGGHFWWTYSTNALDTCSVRWTPDIPVEGMYNVSAFIPAEYSTASGARYVITHSNGLDTVYINQGNYSNEWVSLGDFLFSPGYSHNVKLGDATGTQSQYICFDDMRWHLLSGIGEEPEITESNLNFTLPRGKYRKITLYDITGRNIMERSNVESDGSYSLKIDRPGIYFLKTFKKNKTDTYKITVIR